MSSRLNTITKPLILNKRIMGQNPSSSFDLNELKDDVCRGTQTLKELAVISYDEFLEKVKELNRICQTLSRKISERSNNSKSLLLFAVKKGTDESILWKGTVRIGCVLNFHADASPGAANSFCPQAELERKLFSWAEPEAALVRFFSRMAIIIPLTLSPRIASEKAKNYCYLFIYQVIIIVILLHFSINAELSDPMECCICMERDSEITLPCAHSYCLVCIEQWNVSNKTCPICREKLENTDDSWVMSEIPDTEIVSAELLQTLMGMIEKIT
ncbi:RING finger protein 141-like [Centruroides sculpturatus]|uniref:RING finger protein 141-like n=1 Tax=Centruroides sculpturatus TaxID=218467 RepID=UPI000C6E302B|nr:RING finger protein 141-like [Centruroides sculpturatus]